MQPEVAIDDGVRRYSGTGVLGTSASDAVRGAPATAPGSDGVKSRTNHGEQEDGVAASPGGALTVTCRPGPGDASAVRDNSFFRVVSHRSGPASDQRVKFGGLVAEHAALESAEIRGEVLDGVVTGSRSRAAADSAGAAVSWAWPGACHGTATARLVVTWRGRGGTGAASG
jgi:hypothetical protein